MQYGIITICSVLTVLIGWIQQDRTGFIIGLGPEGRPLYPLSSGSNDGFILSLGFMSFLGTVIYSLGSSLLKSTPKRLPLVYLLNLSLLIMAVVLVELDSSLAGSARYGDILPVLGLITAFFPASLFVIKRLANIYRAGRAG